MNHKHFEQDLTSCIRGQAKQLIAIHCKNLQVSGFVPGNQQQSSFDFDMYCYDLILQASNSRMLLLEVKYLAENEKSFYHFPKEQYAALIDLQKSSLPIYVCYNNAIDYEDAPGRFYATVCCLTSSPSHVIDPNSRKIWKGEHVPLRTRIFSSLLQADAPTSLNFESSILKTPILTALTTRALIFAYNPQLNHLITLSGEELAIAINGYARYLGRDIDNGKDDLPPLPEPKPNRGQIMDH